MSLVKFVDGYVSADEIMLVLRNKAKVEMHFRNGDSFDWHFDTELNAIDAINKLIQQCRTLHGAVSAH